MRETFGKRYARSRVAIIAAFILIALAALSAIVLAVITTRAEQLAARSLQIRAAQAELFSLVKDAERGQRGYLLTQDRNYLLPFNDARRRLPAMRANLERLVDDAAQRGRLTEVLGNIDDKMTELERTIALHSKSPEAALAFVRTNFGRDIMGQIRAGSMAFDYAERQRIADRQARVAILRTALVALIVIALVAVAALAYLILSAARQTAHELVARNQSLLRESAERERAEGMLRQAQKMEALGQLTGGVAHDFNNMLAIIVGSLDILMRRLGDAVPQQRQLVENAMTGAKRASALTRRLLAFSRLQPLDPKPTDVNKCVTDMSEMLRRSLGHHILVETVLGGGLWRAHIDAPQLESAILNLAVNARDAMQEGGRLTIETSNAFLDQAYADQHAEVEAGQYVLIAITDTGTGMPPEVLEKAFDPFFTTKKVGEGTGLGLSQVHGFLKQSGGHIKIYTELGVGTTVKLYLPRDTSGAPPVDLRKSGPVIEGREHQTILVVEDDPGVRSFVVGALRELGFGVAEADSAAVALERLEQEPSVSLLLTDVVMPGVTGRQLVDTALGRYPDLKVLYMTGYTRNAIVHNGVLDPGTRLLTKPFTLEELERELSLALGEK